MQEQETSAPLHPAAQTPTPNEDYTHASLETQRTQESAASGESDGAVFHPVLPGSSVSEDTRGEVALARTDTNADLAQADTDTASRVDTGVYHEADTAKVFDLDIERLKRQIPVEATRTPVSDTSVQDTRKQVARTPLWQLDIQKWDTSQSGNGYSIRFRLRKPDPLTGRKSRYHCWVRMDEYDDFKRQFSVAKAVQASRNVERLRRLATRRS